MCKVSHKKLYLEQVKFLRPRSAINPCRLLERSAVQNLPIEVLPALLVQNKGHAVMHVHSVYALRDSLLAWCCHGLLCVVPCRPKHGEWCIKTQDEVPAENHRRWRFKLVISHAVGSMVMVPDGLNGLNESINDAWSWGTGCMGAQKGKAEVANAGSCAADHLEVLWRHIATTV